VPHHITKCHQSAIFGDVKARAQRRLNLLCNISAIRASGRKVKISHNRDTTLYSSILSTVPIMENASTATIAGRAWACAIRFNALVSQASRTTSAFEDQLARFNIWAANIGVFAEAHASLDYRVRNSPKVKAMVIQLLQALTRKLQFGEYLFDVP
jgi:hypothetical protein